MVRALANGVPSVAVLPSGGDEGDQLIRLLKAEGVEVLAVPISGRTRSNITLAEPDGTVTKVNEPGPAMFRAELDEVTDRVLTRAVDADWVVLCGSVPPGLPADAYAQLCRKLRAAGVRVAVDTSGPALREAALAGATLLKPNRDELAEVVGSPLADLGDVVDAAQRLRAWGAGTVVASLGADGAVLVDADGVVMGTCPVVRPRSTVGAGDALLAGFLAAGARGAAALAEGLAWGAAAVSLPGSRMPGPADLFRHAVTIHPRPDELLPLLPPGPPS